MKGKWLVSGIAIAILLSTGCSVSGRTTSSGPPPTRDVQGECIRAGGKFVVHADGSWECQPMVSQPTRPPVPPPPPLQPAANQPSSAQPAIAYTRWINRHTQKCLTAAGEDHLVQRSCGYGDEQLFKDLSSSYFKLESKRGTCVGFRPEHAELIEVSCSQAPVWTLRPFGTYYGIRDPVRMPHGHPIVAPQELGVYFELQSGGLCLDDDGWEHTESNAIIADGCRDSNHDNQLWAKH